MEGCGTDYFLTAASTFAELFTVELKVVMDWMVFMMQKCPTIRFVPPPHTLVRTPSATGCATCWCLPSASVDSRMRQ